MTIDCGWWWMVQEGEMAPPIKCGHPHIFTCQLQKSLLHTVITLVLLSGIWICYCLSNLNYKFIVEVKNWA